MQASFANPLEAVTMMADTSTMQHVSVEDRNACVLGHFVHIWRGRLSDNTLAQHVLNIQYFMEAYLSYGVSGVHDAPRSVDQVTAYDVYSFITDWLPRKGLVVSARRVKSYLASLTKLYQLMGEHHYIPPEQAADIVQTLKLDRQEMIEAVLTYDDEPDESQSTDEAFFAQLRERWQSIPPDTSKG
jgi:hypothetical protein